MKSDSRINVVEGIEQGESLLLTAINDDMFTLTVVEPESYGDSRRAASMALTRTQVEKINKALKEALNV